NQQFLPLHKVICQVADIARGLSFLHSHNIMHRDLKTENIYAVINDSNQIQILAIGDFDVSFQLSSKSKPKSTVGTFHYMAPEVFSALGSIIYTPKADIFSFGMVLYSILTNTTPFGCYNAIEIQECYRAGERPPITDTIKSQYSPLVSLFQL